MRYIVSVLATLLVAGFVLRLEAAEPRCRISQAGNSPSPILARRVTAQSTTAKRSKPRSPPQRKSGGGSVNFAAGTYLTGPIQLRSNVGCTSTPARRFVQHESRGLSRHPHARGRGRMHELLRPVHRTRSARHRHHRQRTIDGQGGSGGRGQNARATPPRISASSAKPPTIPSNACSAHPKQPFGPCMFEPINCQRILLDGVTFSNSPMWTIHPLYCTDIIVQEPARSRRRAEHRRL